MDNAHDASAEAVHKAKNAAQAVEFAREAQIKEAIHESGQQTQAALIEALKSVFGDSDSENPQQMKVLVRRIPILCTNIEAMHLRLEKIDGNITWGVRIVIGAVLLALLKLVFLG